MATTKAAMKAALRTLAAARDADNSARAKQMDLRTQYRKIGKEMRDAEHVVRKTSAQLTRAKRKVMEMQR